MKTLRFLLVASAAALALAITAAAANAPRPDASTRAETTFVVYATFHDLVPFQAYDFTWTSHYADGDLYVLGGSWGRTPGSDGVLVIYTNVEDLVYGDPGKPLDWVRVCLRPPRSPINTELVGTDGHPICANIETGGYSSGESDEYEYRAPSHAVAVSKMVARTKAAAFLDRR